MYFFLYGQRNVLQKRLISNNRVVYETTRLLEINRFRLRDLLTFKQNHLSRIKQKTNTIEKKTIKQKQNKTSKTRTKQGRCLTSVIRQQSSISSL